jgi:cytochrome oxidase Cu insertion factor (SCO1/SenC/PrrC family)
MLEKFGLHIPKSNMNTKASGRKILLILAVVFVLPFTIAATLHLLEIKPASRSYGELITPPKPLTFPALYDVKGNKFNASNWLKIWSIVTLNANGCDDKCQVQIQMLKQLHTSLGKEAPRIQRVLVLPTEIKNDTVLNLQKNYPDLIILIGTNAEMVEFTNAFKTNSTDTSIYLIDPLGNLMMRYTENQNPKGIQSDIKRLLKNSWAG